VVLVGLLEMLIILDLSPPNFVAKENVHDRAYGNVNCELAMSTVRVPKLNVPGEAFRMLNNNSSRFGKYQPRRNIVLLFYSPGAARSSLFYSSGAARSSLFYSSGAAR